MIPDSKKAAMLIISKGKGPSVEGPKEEASEGSDLKMIADDLLSAVKAGSADGVLSALKAFHACIRDEDEEQDQEVE